MNIVKNNNNARESYKASNKFCYDLCYLCYLNPILTGAEGTKWSLISKMLFNKYVLQFFFCEPYTLWTPYIVNPIHFIKTLLKCFITFTVSESSSHRTALLVLWPLKPAVLSDRSTPVWQGHKMWVAEWTLSGYKTSSGFLMTVAKTL